jgi:hypothetical protein
MNLTIHLPKAKKIMIPKDIRFYAIFLYFASSPLSKLFYSVGVPRELFYLVTILFIVLSVMLNKNTATNDVIVFYLISLPIILFGIFNNHSYIDKSTNLYSIFLEMLPGYIIVRLTKGNLNLLIKALKSASYLTLVYYVPFALNSSFRLDYMAYAYWIQIPLCVIFYYAITQRKFRDIVLSLIGTMSLVIFGARGALLGYIAFITFTLVLNSEKRHWGIISFLGFIGATFLINIKKLTVWLSNKGLTSRTLLKISEGDFTISNTRVPLYEQCKFYIRESLLTGYGPLGSRSVIVGYPYPHSIVYEMILDYGIIIGSIILGFIIFTGLYMLLKSKGDYRFLASLFFITGILRLSVSNSFYYVNYISITIALFITYKKYIRITVRSRNL